MTEQKERDMTEQKERDRIKWLEDSFYLLRQIDDRDKRKDIISRYLENFDVNSRDTRDYSLLMLVSEAGYDECVSLLLDRGADINSQNRKSRLEFGGMTALMLASQGGYDECVSLLLDRGALVNQQNDLGYTCLLYTSPSPRDS